MPLQSPAQLDRTALHAAIPMKLADCPVRPALDVLRGKWKPLILFSLKSGTMRYTELRTRLSEAPEKVFIQQLRELERDQIIDRLVHTDVPPRVEYCLSLHGETLISVLRPLAEWGKSHRAHMLSLTSGHLSQEVLMNRSLPEE